MAIRWPRLIRNTVLAVAVLFGGFVAFVYFASERRLGRRHSVQTADIAVPDDSASLERGRHLYTTISCALCHGEDGGGMVYADQMPMGRIVGPNLTRGRGGGVEQRSNLDWVRAIRHGVRPDSTSLIVMPSEVFVHLSDQDLGAIIAWLRSLPPVDRELPSSDFGWLGRFLLATGRLNILPAEKTPPFEPPAPVLPGPTREYGRYLADISGCHGCHGYGLSGGRVAGPPDLPPASNITPEGLGGWTQADFVRLMRNGLRPGTVPVHEFMPWRQFRHMTDDELAALWAYLQSVPTRPSGNK